MYREFFLEQARNICKSTVDGDNGDSYYGYKLFLKESGEIDWDSDKNVAGFLKEYGHIHLEMKGKIKNDIKNVTISYGQEDMCRDRIVIWEDLNIFVAEIAYMYNTSHKRISFFMSENSLFFDENHKKIADNAEDFLEYLLTVKCEYHESVSDETIKKLKSAGWYPGRNIDISELVYQCEEDEIFLSDNQKQAISEFGGIRLLCGGENSLYISEKRKSGSPYYRKMVSDKNNPQFHPLTSSFGTGIILIGDNDNAMGHLYLTVDGMLVDDYGIQYGLNVLEGLHVLLNE